jgi:AraC-like DNA-binding protein
MKKFSALTLWVEYIKHQNLLLFTKALFGLYLFLIFWIVFQEILLTDTSNKFTDLGLDYLILFIALIMSAITLSIVIAAKQIETIIPNDTNKIISQKCNQCILFRNHEMITKTTLDISENARFSPENGIGNVQYMQVEDPFVLQVKNILEKNLENETFSINILCSELAISRAQLYRKFNVNNHTGISDYLKSLRLSKAKKLLADSDMNVTEVAFAAGFKNLSHFSREFTLKYGITPKKMKQTHINFINLSNNSLLT